MCSCVIVLLCMWAQVTFTVLSLGCHTGVDCLKSCHWSKTLGCCYMSPSHIHEHTCTRPHACTRAHTVWRWLHWISIIHLQSDSRTADSAVCGKRSVSLSLPSRRTTTITCPLCGNDSRQNKHFGNHQSPVHLLKEYNNVVKAPDAFITDAITGKFSDSWTYSHV